MSVGARLAPDATGYARPARRQPRRGLVITYRPAVLIALVCLLGTALLPMLASKGALVFLLAGSVLVAMRPGEVLAAMRRNWLVVALVAWCLVSVTWSDYPAVTVRYGVQLLLTMLIAMALADRLPPALFVRLVLVAQLAASLASLASGRTRSDGAGYLGIYASKNALAASSGLLVIVAVAILFDRRSPRLWRLTALMSLGIGFVLLVMAKSTGALIAVAGTVAAFGVLYVLRRLEGPLRFAVVAMALILIAAAAVILSGMFAELSQAFLGTTGKDLTLTGRTDLWATAFAEIAQRPFLGTGYQAFWVVGNPGAEELWSEFGIESRSGFNFHNTLISNAVEIGLVGAAMQAVLFFGALWAVLSWTIRSPGAASIFFALFMVRQFVLMQVELVFFTQFDFTTVITFVAIFHAAGFRQAARAMDAPTARRVPRGWTQVAPVAPTPQEWPRARSPIRPRRVFSGPRLHGSDRA